MVKKIKVKTKKTEKYKVKQGLRKKDSSTPVGKRGGAPSVGSAPPAHSQFATEKLNRVIARIMEEKEFKDMDEANEYFQKHIVGRNIDELIAELETNPIEMAQDIAYQAMESDNIEEVFKLVKEALKLDPNNIDALVMAATLTAGTEEKRIELISSILSKAEQNFGKKFFKENRGHFWGMVETRPYMRARQNLIYSQLRAGRIDEAIRNCEDMIALNPNDNQGIRDMLLGLYLETDNLKGAQKLFKQYPGTHFAVFAWGKVLAYYISGDINKAKRAFKEANKNNPYVVDLLTNRKRPSHELPEFYSLGDRNEAISCFHEIGKAWRKYPQAVEWLKSLKN